MQQYDPWILLPPFQVSYELDTVKPVYSNHPWEVGQMTITERYIQVNCTEMYGKIYFFGNCLVTPIERMTSIHRAIIDKFDCIFSTILGCAIQTLQ